MISDILIAATLFCAGVAIVCLAVVGLCKFLLRGWNRGHRELY